MSEDVGSEECQVDHRDACLQADVPLTIHTDDTEVLEAHRMTAGRLDEDGN